MNLNNFNFDNYMNTNLTLQLDEQLIQFGTAWAQQQGKTLSQLIADYLMTVKKLSEPTTELPPKIDYNHHFN